MANVFTIIMVIILVVLGILFLSRGYYPFKKRDDYVSNDDKKCPNLLIQKGNQIELFNSNKPKVEGVNPLKFNSLEEYIDFVELQRRNGLRCPVLFLKQMYTTQGDAAYSVRPSPTNLQGGLPPDTIVKKQQTPSAEQLLTDANHDDPPYNANSFPGFDPYNQDIGRNTPLDKMFRDDKNPLSPNPMDTNWGGHEYTQNLVDQELKTKITQDTRYQTRV